MTSALILPTHSKNFSLNGRWSLKPWGLGLQDCVVEPEYPKLSGGSRSAGGADRTAVLASIQVTAKMRGINFREVGERLLHGDPDPLRRRKGTPGPPGP